MDGNLLDDLLSIQRSVEAALERLGVVREVESETFAVLTPGEVCDHPPAARRAAGVMGAPAQYFCLRCDQLVNGRPEETPDAPARDHPR